MLVDNFPVVAPSAFFPVHFYVYGMSFYGCNMGGSSIPNFLQCETVKCIVNLSDNSLNVLSVFWSLKDVSAVLILCLAHSWETV